MTMASHETLCYAKGKSIFNIAEVSHVSPSSIYIWTQEIAARLPTLNRALATVLALWTIGMILARRCGLDQRVSVAAWYSASPELA